MRFFSKPCWWIYSHKNAQRKTFKRYVSSTRCLLLRCLSIRFLEHCFDPASGIFSLNVDNFLL
jgi:hypothetical protein